MNIQFVIIELDHNSEVFKDLLQNISREDYLWKQEDKKWCLLEIVCHLYDEEREDFRARVKYVLELPDRPPDPINPVGWVKERKYIEQNYSDMLNKFLNERMKSVEWLKQLKDPKWDNVYEHPQAGKMSAFSFLSSWLAHDYLHIRQIVKLKYDLLSAKTGDLSYAGGW